MAEDEVRARIREVIRELAPTADIEPTPDTRLVDDLGYDSLGLLELMFRLEEEFGLPPTDEPTGRSITTVARAEDHVLAVMHT